MTARCVGIYDAVESLSGFLDFMFPAKHWMIG